jgi:hypothetical protein
MKVGDLVTIARSSIGVPHDALGLIIGADEALGTGGTNMWHVELMGTARRLTGRYLEGDLEVVSGSR